MIHDGTRDFTHGADGSVASVRSVDATRRLKHDVNGQIVEVIESNGTVITYEVRPVRTADGKGRQWGTH